MDFKIDDNVPYTHGRLGRYKFAKNYPIDQLEINQSFLIEDDSSGKVFLSLYNRVAQNVWRYNEAHRGDGVILKYSRRTMYKHGEQGIRIWKLKKENP